MAGVASGYGTLALMKQTLCAFLCLAGLAWSEPVVRAVDPATTDPQVRQMRGPHLACWDDEEPANGLLLVSLGGTNSLPSDLEPFDRTAAELGYCAVGIDYPNQVISTACRDSTQMDAFDHFRAEIVTGSPESDLIEVAPGNSVENRLTRLLRQLAKGPEGSRWQPFLTATGPVWSKIVVVGHSQGSGHAAYLGKLHPLRGVVMLAGPQDSGAGWLSRPGQTLPQNYLALLHRDDFFQSALQIQSIHCLRGDFSPSEVLVLTEPVRDPHMSVISPRFRALWAQLLKQFLPTLPPG